MVFHSGYRPPLRFWFWWKLLILSHLGAWLTVAGVSKKVSLFSPHVGWQASCCHGVSIAHKNGNYGTSLLSFGNPDLLEVDFSFGTQASYINWWAVASLPPGKPGLSPAGSIAGPIDTEHTFYSLSVIKFKPEKKNSVNPDSTFFVRFIFWSRKKG